MSPSSSPFAAPEVQPRPGKQVEQWLIRDRGKLPYLLFLPQQYTPDRQWPLMLFLHGADERGNAQLDRLKRHGPPKVVERQPDFPFVVVSPQCPLAESWFDGSRQELLLELLDETIDRFAIDPDRVYLTGISMGGFGTWLLAGRRPQRFAALVPICGGGNPHDAERLARLPIWAFHGARDEIVPLHWSSEMVEAVERAGGQARFTVYPEAEHDSWTAAYDNPQLYEWLLQQRRR